MKNRYTPFEPHFYYIKVGFKGVYIIRTCFRDVCIWAIWFAVCNDNANHRDRYFCVMAQCIVFDGKKSQNVK